MSYCRKKNWSSENEIRINKQIGLELYASHAYNNLYSYFKSDAVGFNGIAEYFKKCSDEEIEHARQFMDYQNIRGGRVELGMIESPLFEFNINSDKSILHQALYYALELEQKVYSSILDISKSSNDAGLEDFLDDFIKEQLEAQYDLGMRLKQLEIIGKDGHGMVDYDKNMF